MHANQKLDFFSDEVLSLRACVYLWENKVLALKYKCMYKQRRFDSNFGFFVQVRNT